MKNKKIINLTMIIISIVGIFLIGGGLYLTSIKPTPVKDEPLYDLPEESRLYIENCKTDQCPFPEKDSYNKLVLKKDYKALNKKIDKINQDTKKYYEQVKQTTTDTEKCAAVKDLYYHEQRVSTKYFNYENDKYVSIAVQRDIFNLCDNGFERKKIECYIYDKKSHNLLSQEDFLKKENITLEEIEAAYASVIKIINEEDKLNIIPQKQYADTVYYYDFEGNILVSFYVPEKNLYYSGTVRENKNK